MTGLGGPYAVRGPYFGDPRSNKRGLINASALGRRQCAELRPAYVLYFNAII